MKKQLEMVYRCEHCNRAMLGASAMSRHEKYCKENPHNQHKCFDFCKHLKMTRNYSYDECGNQRGGTEMLCEKRNVKMYSF